MKYFNTIGNDFRLEYFSYFACQKYIIFDNEYIHGGFVLVLLYRDPDSEFGASQSLGIPCGDFSSVHFNYLFTEIEPHSETRRFASSECCIFLKKLRYVNSLKSTSVVFDRDRYESAFFARFYENNRVLFVDEFDCIIQEVGNNLLQLDTIDGSKSNLITDLIHELYMSMHARVYFIFCL